MNSERAANDAYNLLYDDVAVVLRPTFTEDFLDHLYGRGEEEARALVEDAGGALRVTHMVTAHRTADGCVIGVEMSEAGHEVSVVVGRLADHLRGTDGADDLPVAAVAADDDGVDHSFLSRVAAENEEIARGNGRAIVPGAPTDNVDGSSVPKHVADDASLDADDSEPFDKPKCGFAPDAVNEVHSLFGIEQDDAAVGDFKATTGREASCVVEDLLEEDRDEFELFDALIDDAGASDGDADVAPTGRSRCKVAFLVGAYLSALALIGSSIYAVLLGTGGNDSESSVSTAAVTRSVDQQVSKSLSQRAKRSKTRRRAPARQTTREWGALAPISRPVNNPPAPAFRGCDAAASEFSIDC